MRLMRGLCSLHIVNMNDNFFFQIFSVFAKCRVQSFELLEFYKCTVFRTRILFIDINFLKEFVDVFKVESTPGTYLANVNVNKTEPVTVVTNNFGATWRTLKSLKDGNEYVAYHAIL